jgi:hypothetical protein
VAVAVVAVVVVALAALQPQALWLPPYSKLVSSPS